MQESQLVSRICLFWFTAHSLLSSVRRNVVPCPLHSASVLPSARKRTLCSRQLSLLMQIGAFAYGAQLGFERSRALKHAQTVYQRLVEVSTAHNVNAWLIERCWLMLFGGAHFQDL